jgi:hypothetical protein
MLPITHHKVAPSGWKDPDALCVQRFWTHMQSTYGSRTVDKNDAAEMKLVAAFLNEFNIVDDDEFMEHFTTTIGKNIYTPFDIGSDDGRWSLWGQITVCTHEHQHIGQAAGQGFVSFAQDYLAKSEKRTAYECDAYACDLQLHHWRYRDLPESFIDRVLHSLESYALTETDLRVARKLLKLRALIIRKGGIANDASRTALDWLNEHAPHLRVPA